MVESQIPSIVLDIGNKFYLEYVDQNDSGKSYSGKIHGVGIGIIESPFSKIGKSLDSTQTLDQYCMDVLTSLSETEFQTLFGTESTYHGLPLRYRYSEGIISYT